MYKLTSLFFGIIALMISFYSCKPDEDFLKDPSFNLSFSADTVKFDTVFTTVGSVTLHFKVINSSNQVVNISEIKLAGGASSFYRINVDGNSNLTINDVELDGGDSLYVFVNVTIDPDNRNNPFYVKDSIIFTTNGNQQNVKLIAYGQNAHFLQNAILQGNHIWTNEKPYVIRGLVVVSDTLNSTLTIQAGSRLFFHSGALLAVDSSASLKVLGTFEEPVTFLGDRYGSNVDQSFTNPSILEASGQWGHPIFGGVWLSKESVENIINYAIIRNGMGGIRVDTLGSSNEPVLQINNTVIDNMSTFGILAQSSYVKAANCLFSNCGIFAIGLNIGGNYDFRHCTAANFYNGSNGTVILNNYYIDNNDDTISSDLTNAYFGNCILYGNSEEEILFGKSSQAEFNFTFDNCLLKTEKNIMSNGFINCIANKDTVFADVEKSDFRLDSTRSAAYNTADIEIINNSGNPLLQYDLFGVSRLSDEAPDIGVFEYRPE